MAYKQRFNLGLGISYYLAWLWLFFPVAQAQTDPISHFRFIGEYTLPADLHVNNTWVGGLSGLDYDHTQKNWVIISDDKAQNGPVRFYRAEIAYDLQAIRHISINKAVLLKNQHQALYTDNTQLIPDAEAIRVDPQDGSIWWTGEGYIAKGSYPKKAKDPTIFHTSATGDYIEAVPTLQNLRACSQKKWGLRHNKGLEGLSFSADGQTLWAAMEGPMFQDSKPSTASYGGDTRITHFNRQGQVLAQYAYRLDPVPAQFLQEKGALREGISDILVLDADRLIVIERLFAANQGSLIKLYEIRTQGATDIRTMPALKKRDFTPVHKRLLLTLDHTTYPNIGNVEGISWGPQLENGHHSLVLVTDNNFSTKQRMQFLIFEVIPTAKI